MESHLQTEKHILNLSFVGSLLFLVAEIFASWYTGSKAILMDCVYDLTDLIMIGPFLILIPLLYKPVTEKRPYGFSQLESLFVILKYSVLLIVEIILCIDSILTILHGGNHIDATFVSYFELAVSAGCLVMFLVIRKLNRKYTSPSIKAEMYIWKLDTLSTLGVSAAFIISLLISDSSFSYIVPYIDPGIAILLALILMKEPIEMIIESLRSLLLYAPDNNTVSKIEEISEDVLSQYGITISFFDIVKTGRSLWVDLYIRTESYTINILDLKDANDRLHDILKEDFENITVELIPDLDKIKKRSDRKNERRSDIINLVEKREKKKQNKNK